MHIVKKFCNQNIQMFFKSLSVGVILIYRDFFSSAIQYQTTSLFVNVFQNKLLTLKADESPF